MKDYRFMFSTSDRHRKLNQLRWQNMSAHLTNEISYWLKKLRMHLNWAIYNVCDLNIDPHVCFSPNLFQDRARPIPLAPPEACPQRSERPVRAHAPHRSRTGYPGWYIVNELVGILDAFYGRKLHGVIRMLPDLRIFAIYFCSNNQCVCLIHAHCERLFP